MAVINLIYAITFKTFPERNKQSRAISNSWVQFLKCKYYFFFFAGLQEFFVEHNPATAEVVRIVSKYPR